MPVRKLALEPDCLNLNPTITTWLILSFSICKKVIVRIKGDDLWKRLSILSSLVCASQMSVVVTSPLWALLQWRCYQLLLTKSLVKATASSARVLLVLVCFFLFFRQMVFTSCPDRISCPMSVAGLQQSSWSVVDWLCLISAPVTPVLDCAVLP